MIKVDQRPQQDFVAPEFSTRLIRLKIRQTWLASLDKTICPQTLSALYQQRRLIFKPWRELPINLKRTTVYALSSEEAMMRILVIFHTNMAYSQWRIMRNQNIKTDRIRQQRFIRWERNQHQPLVQIVHFKINISNNSSISRWWMIGQTTTLTERNKKENAIFPKSLIWRTRLSTALKPFQAIKGTHTATLLNKQTYLVRLRRPQRIISKFHHHNSSILSNQCQHLGIRKETNRNCLIKFRRNLTWDPWHRIS